MLVPPCRGGPQDSSVPPKIAPPYSGKTFSPILASKAELSILLRSGTFYFALTCCCSRYRIDSEGPAGRQSQERSGRSQAVCDSVCLARPILITFARFR